MMHTLTREGGQRPNWQGSLSDNLPIWRRGYYQGDDPDHFIRSQLMRNPRRALRANDESPTVTFGASPE
jgi:hypothetical protein